LEEDGTDRKRITDFCKRKIKAKRGRYMNGVGLHKKPESLTGKKASHLNSRKGRA